MPRFFIPVLAILFCAGSFFVRAEETKPSGEKPAGTEQSEQSPQSRYFQDSGSQVDRLVDRIRFKIAYSWMKSGEYFRLAFSSVPDSLPAKQRDVQSRIEIKKDELVEQGKEAVRSAAGQAADKIAEKGAELKDDLGKAGSEIVEETRKDIKEKTDKIVQ
ncbi:MAG: hypothetical protein IJS14_12910 [Lentisphaeria bacterium]|nr:hypothetical protein [Lentisphaeria bacterium]